MASRTPQARLCCGNQRWNCQTFLPFSSQNVLNQALSLKKITENFILFIQKGLWKQHRIDQQTDGFEYSFFTLWPLATICWPVGQWLPHLGSVPSAIVIWGIQGLSWCKAQSEIGISQVHFAQIVESYHIGSTVLLGLRKWWWERLRKLLVIHPSRHTAWAHVVKREAELQRCSGFFFL